MIAGLMHIAGGGAGGPAPAPLVVPLTQPLTDHAAVLEVWAPLTQGGTLVIARPDAEDDVLYLGAFLAEARPAVWLRKPSATLWKMLSETCCRSL